MGKLVQRRGSLGFTLTEVLVTVAIIAVLFAMAMIPANRLYREYSQAALDSKAELIYMAAQNRLTQLAAAGQWDAYQRGVTPLADIPKDAEEGRYDPENFSLVYITSEEKETVGRAATMVMPQDRIEPELWSNHWIVEYDVDSASVYAVFYSESVIEAQNLDSLRYRDRRLQGGAVIGYYGGDSVGAYKTGTLEPRVEVVNGERLYIQITCDTQGTAALSFSVILTDEDGHSTGEIKLSRADGEIEKQGLTYTATMVLDDLTPSANMRFAQQERLTALTAGQDLRVSVKVTADDEMIDRAVVTVPQSVNSLFAAVRRAEGGRTAVITHARHLQNLDEASGLNETDGEYIEAAVQEQDIQFAATTDDSWAALYHDMKFTPIENSRLTSYAAVCEINGVQSHPVIDDLPVVGTGDAGLFKSFANGTLSHIRLSGATISGSGQVGGLVGMTSGEVLIEGCQVFLSPAKGHTLGKNERDLWLSGDVVGGLVGYAAGELRIHDSFAATVMRGETAAGGLVGAAQADIVAERAYADSYIYSGKAAGGILGARDGGSFSVQDCYTGGFLSAPTTAGLAAAALNSDDRLSHCYTVAASLDRGVLDYTTAPSAESAPKVSEVYYLTPGMTHLLGTVYIPHTEWSGEKCEEGVKLLGTAFSADSGYTYPYNLIAGMGLSRYTYPTLNNLPHYGDWQAEFESGSLVYWEKYADGSYGFYGANIDLLNSDMAVVGDGYGMVWSDYAPELITVSYEGQEPIALSGAGAVQINAAENIYCLLPLPKEFVQEVAGGDKFYRRLNVDGSAYYYNPHFANTANVGNDSSVLPDHIIIRTARQLYALSEYYADYTKLLPANTVFMQRRDIDYAVYEWSEFGLGGVNVTEQQPIGSSTTLPFKYVYDGGGHRVSGVSFIDKGGVYAGMFGCNSGELRSIVLLCDLPYNHSAATAVGIAVSAQYKTVYMGMLAGYNNGVIYQCAASGYNMDCHAYSGSTFYIGGLVGYNAGSVRSSSVSAPRIVGSGTYATIHSGGFVGGNSGQIRQSYAVAAVEIMTIRGGEVAIAGFAADNIGTIRNSYCATALSSAGAATYGFAPNSGSVVDCFFLNGGTYSFAGEMHRYQYAAGNSGAKGLGEKALAAQYIKGFGAVQSGNTPSHPNTIEDEAGYPFVSSVTQNGAFVHWGDWVVPARLGDMGVVYWEYEEGGSNEGIHFSFIGFEHGERISGSSLCQTHDDGGTIRKYGYGYFWREDESQPVLTASVSGGSFHLGAAQTDVQRDLAAQAEGYKFVAYATGDKGLRLETTTSANGMWSLSQGTITYNYSVCPFFAEAYEDIQSGTAALPGDDAKPYMVRSVEQLQYINWSVVDGSGSAVRDVTTSNYKAFPYLQYATKTGQAAQTKADAEKNRPTLRWVQNHDINGAASAAPQNAHMNRSIHPIAGAVEHRQQEAYTMVLYNWFGGKYDGQSYYIKNVNIDSYCYNVGLFGTTAGAEIRNIILYSDNQAVIRRSTKPSDWRYQGTGSPASPEEYICSYALGGLVGIAYDYKDDLGKSTVENCAIAGYIVSDESKNALQLGEAGIGGLIGVSSVNLRNCSAVVDLRIDCTHRWKNDGSLNSALWGNFIRVGGLVGGLRYTATNCYSGGSITVGAETLRERIEAGDNTNLKFADGSQAVNVKWTRNRGGTVGNTYNKNLNPATYVYIGGIGGSGFSANFYNFTNKNDSDDGTPTFVNCYTYIDLPDMEGTITGICLIGSTADRYKYANAKIENCYYLESTANSVGFDKLSKCINPTNYSLAELLSSKQAREEMLNGNLAYLKSYMWENGIRYNVNNGLTKLSYAQMASRDGGAGIIKQLSTDTAVYDTAQQALGNGYDWVTVVEGGATIHGKYSFPGDDAALKGQDYPFPTVLTQTDVFNTKVNLHYGEWPKEGLFWEDGIVSVDMISDYSPERHEAAIPLRLLADTLPNSAELSGLPTFTYSDNSIVSATAVRAADGSFDVMLKGLRIGAAEVVATWGGYSARLTVTVTADLSIIAEPIVIEEYVGGKTAVTLKAVDKGGDLRPVSWRIVNEDDGVAVFSTPVANADNTVVTTDVSGVGEGETTLHITATYAQDNGNTYVANSALSVIIRVPATGIGAEGD